MGLKRTGKIKKVDTSSKILERESKFGTGKGLPTNSVRFIRLSGVYGEIKHIRIIIENRLRAVAVMNIKIHNQHFLQVIFCLDVTRTDCDIISRVTKWRPKQ